MKWLEVATEPEDIQGALARLGLAPRGPPKATPMRGLLGQLTLPFGSPADRVLTASRPPTLLDFEDLDDYMTAHHATYEKRVSTLGGVQLVARGESVRALADWLATAFASGIRRRSD